MLRKFVPIYIVVVIGLFISQTLEATKPCPPNPCHTKGEFDSLKCSEVSLWIADGKIINVHHNFQGQPFNKDFSSFTFQIDNWEKGNFKEINELKFEVGWCNNMQAAPSDTSLTYRFYGIGTPGSETNQAQYLHIEVVKDK